MNEGGILVKDNKSYEDKIERDYFKLEMPQDIDGYMESVIRRVKISRKNRYIAPLIIIVICSVIMACY